MEAIVFRLIQVYVSNIVFTLKIRLCLYKIAINYELDFLRKTVIVQLNA